MKIARILVGVILLMLVAYDAAFHFDATLVERKLRNNSAQRHWNWHYDQSHVYQHSSMRYEVDFDAIRERLEPDYVGLSDLTTSYYAAAYLPLYVKNTHRHQGRNRDSAWAYFLKTRDFCNIDVPSSRVRLERFRRWRSEDSPTWRYWIVNKDRQNRNLKIDCLATQSDRIIEAFGDLGALLYEGEYLNLYELKPSGRVAVEP